MKFRDCENHYGANCPNCKPEPETLGDYTDLIKKWAIDRNLHTANPAKQMLKLGEEFGELAGGMARGNMETVKDSIGDMFVVMTILSMQLGIDIEECVAGAYDEIKDRRGKMIDGVFVKEADLLSVEEANKRLREVEEFDPYEAAANAAHAEWARDQD